MSDFLGANLKLARQFHGLSLAELGDAVSCSKQFLSRLETGAESASFHMEQSLAEQLEVMPEFFYDIDPMPIAEEQCHFRKQLTTKLALRQVALAKGEMLKRLVNTLDKHLDLPPYKIEEADPITVEAMERAAERCRAVWGLGGGPLHNVTRTAENAGAVVMQVGGLAEEIDAVSFATRRPLIALNNHRRSSCRSRFAIAHELGHFALHAGVLTGDPLTESQANRFASALLMPRSTFAVECRSALRGTRLNWPVLANLKLRWGVSKAAILFRGRQLSVFSDDQTRSGFITLNRHGEALAEVEDHLVPDEQPEVIAEGLEVMKTHFGVPTSAVARSMKVQPSLLQKIVGSGSYPGPSDMANVVALCGRTG